MLRLTDQSTSRLLLTDQSPSSRCPGSDFLGLGCLDLGAAGCNPIAHDHAERAHQVAAYFRHTQVRLESRYGLNLERPVWDAWNTAIRTTAPEALFVALAHDGGSAIWRVWLHTRVIFVVVRDAMVVTVLPNERQFAGLVRRAIRQRAAKLPPTPPPQRPASRQVVKLPVRRLLPKLPPRHLWPPRDEAVLARLRSTATALVDDDVY